MIPSYADGARDFPRVIDCISRDDVPLGIPHKEWGGTNVLYERVDETTFITLPSREFANYTSSHQQFYPVDSEGNWTGKPEDVLFIL